MSSCNGKKGLSLMIWHDLLESSMGEGSGASIDPVYSCYGHAESQDGRRFDWHLHTSDGGFAKFTIDDTGYDLTAGTLFMVTTTNGKTRVKQLRRDLSSVRASRESCLGFGLRDRDIASFVLTG